MVGDVVWQTAEAVTRGGGYACLRRLWLWRGWWWQLEWGPFQNCGDMVATGITSERYGSFLFSTTIEAPIHQARCGKRSGLCTRPAFDEHRLIINIIYIYIYMYGCRWPLDSCWWDDTGSTTEQLSQPWSGFVLVDDVCSTLVRISNNQLCDVRAALHALGGSERTR
jgi:hypothetical protein